MVFELEACYLKPDTGLKDPMTSWLEWTLVTPSSSYTFSVPTEAVKEVALARMDTMASPKA